MSNKTIGWVAQIFLVGLLFCGLSIPLGIAVGWWASAIFMGGLILIGVLCGLEEILNAIGAWRRRRS